MLLLLINDTPNAKGILTGKLFEYLASGRPILCIGPEDGDAARILNETKAGTTVSFEGKEKMKKSVKALFNKYLEGNLANNTSPTVEQYSRRNLAGEFAEMLNKVKS